MPFVRISNLRNGLIDDFDIAYISEETHAAESKTALTYGDLVLSKTAYPAASFVNLPRCNVSQDTIAVRISPAWQKRLRSAYLAAFLNSQYGLTLLWRQFQGNVQMHLSLPDGEKIKLPLFSVEFQDKVNICFVDSFNKQQESYSIYSEAERTLLAELGLLDWQPPEALSYERKASEAFASGRLDAEYFDPRVQALLQTLNRQNLTVGKVARVRKEYFNPARHETFHYIEISDLSGDGEADSSIVAGSDAPDRATWYVRSNDVITSTVRPIRRLSALIHPEQSGFVCSSGFVVLQPCDVSPEVLLVYLRLTVIAELMDLHTTASMYPAISVSDILNIPFLKPSADAAAQIVRHVREAHAARRRAKRLLELAKRAVEIAIEDSEAAAMKFLDSESE